MNIKPSAKYLSTPSPEMTVAELLALWPQSIPVLLNYHLDCVGCRMASFDSLADVTASYHLVWQNFEADLNNAIQSTNQ